MILQRTINGWTCLPASFATVLGLTLEDLLRRLGHDGSEVVWPTLAGPASRRAFHPQEILDVAEGMGVAFTQIEARPTSRPRFAGPQVPSYEVPLDVYPRWQRHLEGNVGVLTGLNLIGRPHAVAWDGSEIHDPSTGEAYGTHLFQPETFFKARVAGPAFRPQ